MILKQKLLPILLFFVAGISMANTIDVDHFGKENLDKTGKINYRVKNTCVIPENAGIPCRIAGVCYEARNPEQTAPCSRRFSG